MDFTILSPVAGATITKHPTNNRAYVAISLSITDPQLTAYLSGYVRIGTGGSLETIASVGGLTSWSGTVGLYVYGTGATGYVHLEIFTPVGSVVHEVAVNVEIEGGSETPTCLIISPDDQAQVTRTIPITVEYSGFDDGSGSLALEWDGEVAQSETVSLAAAGGTLNTSLSAPGAADGEHVLGAIVSQYPASAAASITVQVGDEAVAGPTVIVIAPVSDATVTGDASVAATVTAGDAAIETAWLEVDGVQSGSALTAPTTGTWWEFPWNSRIAPNGTHTLRIVARDVDGVLGWDDVIVNAGNSQADRELVRFTPQLGPGLVEGAAFDDRDYTQSIETLVIPEPPDEAYLQWLLQVGYNKPGSSRAWDDYRLVSQIGAAHALLPATGSQVSWAIRAVPRQTVTTWALAADDVLRLAVGDGVLYALAADAVYRINLATGAVTTHRDLSWLSADPVDMVYSSADLVIAYGDLLVLLDPQTGAVDVELRLPAPDALASVDRLALDADGDLIIAATLAAGGSRLYRYDWRRAVPIADHADAITCLALLGAALYAGDAAGNVLEIADSSITTAYATGQAAVRSLALNGTTVYAGTGTAGRVYPVVGGAATAAETGWDVAAALATYRASVWAGGTGTGASYLRYERGAGDWPQEVALTGASAVRDLAVYTDTGGAEQLLAAVTRAGTTAAIMRVELGAGDLVCGPDWIENPEYAFEVLR